MEEEIRTIEEDVTVLGVTSVNGLTGDVPLKTINGEEVTGEGNIEISGGEGTVKSVNSISPDENGNVTLTASDVGAATTSDIETAVATKQDALSNTQMDAVNSGIDSTKTGQIATNTNAISAINGKIPSAASTDNQLADKNFVNSSVATNTANYISNNGQPFDSLAELEAYSGTLTNNDYAFVVGTDTAGNTTYTRYKYNATTQTWAEEYVLNNSSFTSAQWNAINSGITSGDVAKLVNFTGTDGTAVGTAGLVPAPATTDAGKVLSASGAWTTPDAGIKTLTSADYNYPTTGTKNTVALWLVKPGWYNTTQGVSWSINTNTTNVQPGTFLVSVDSSSGRRTIVRMINGMAWAYGVSNQGTEYWSDSALSDQNLLRGKDTANNLTSTGTKAPLSANQGRVLNDKIVGTTETFTIADTDWTALASSDPYDYQATVTATATIDSSTGVVELLNDSPVDFATYGFAIGAVNASTKAITIYSIGQPSASVTLKINIRNL